MPGAAPICCPLLSCNWFVLIGLCSLFPDYLMYGNKCSFPPGSANFPPVPSGSNKVQGGHRGAESGFWWGPGGLALVCSHIRPLPLSIDRSFEAGRGSGMRGLVKRNKSRLYFKSQWIIYSGWCSFHASSSPGLHLEMLGSLCLISPITEILSPFFFLREREIQAPLYQIFFF